MITRIKMHAYKNASESATALAKALGINKLLTKGSKFRGRKGDVILNWGSSTPHPNQKDATYTNHPDKVKLATNKLSFQHHMQETGNPYRLNHFQTKKAAEIYLEHNPDYSIVCRKVLNGHSGAGIVIANTAEELVDAPLYTVYEKKTDEYRVHVFDGKIIDIQRKARKGEVKDEDVNWKVRNLDGGFIFARKDVVAPAQVCASALDTIHGLGLLHGAVDVGFNKYTDKAYVYEVNTACGLAGSTLRTYEIAFRTYFELPITADPEDYVGMKPQPINNIEQLKKYLAGEEDKHIPDEAIPVEPIPVVEEMEADDEEPIPAVFDAQQVKERREEIAKAAFNMAGMERNTGVEAKELEAVAQGKAEVAEFIIDLAHGNAEIKVRKEDIGTFFEYMLRGWDDYKAHN